VPAADLKVENGSVFVAVQPEKKVSYAELTRGKRIERQLDQRAVEESVAEFTMIGKPVLRRDAVDKVTGKAQYTSDLRLPDMLCAAILRPPAHGATLKSVDTSETEKLPGVHVVKTGELVAVLHRHPDVADEGAQDCQGGIRPADCGAEREEHLRASAAVAPPGKTVADGATCNAARNWPSTPAKPRT